MHPIFARNSAHAIVTIMDLLRVGPSIGMRKVGEPESELVEYKVIPCPITIVIGEPTERTIPWDWWKMDPLAGLLHGMQMVAGSYGYLKKIGNCQELTTVDFAISNPAVTNHTATFKISIKGNLDMMVFDRSRVGVTYLFGTAVPRYTMIHELLAAMLKVPIGVYSHVCGDLATVAESIPNGVAPPDLYTQGKIRQYPMIEGDVELFVRDVAMLCSEGPVMGITNKFVKEVAGPIWQAFTALTQSGEAERFGTALEHVKRCRASDWRECAEGYISQQASSFLMDSLPSTPPKLTLVN